MFGSKTTAADVEEWSQAKAVDRVARALSDRDPTVRTAAASALRHVDPNHTSQATLDAAVSSLLKYLTSADSGLVAEAARALGYVGSNEALGPLIATLDHTREAEVRAAASWAIAHIVDSGTNKANAFRHVFGRLSQQPRLNAEAMDALLYALAKAWVGQAPRSRPEIEGSAWGRAFVALGPAAGRQLLRVAEGRSPEVAAFGARLVEPPRAALRRDCDHVLDATCRCTRCGNFRHDFSHGCVCKGCGLGHHDWSEGVINGYLHPCRRCKAYMHAVSGNITEP